MGVRQINPSQINKFRNFLYSTSSGKIGAGNLISLNIYQNQLRGIRHIALTSARLTSDLRSISGSGQGAGLRIQRRIAGRVTGRIGQSVIPQGLGFATRLMNNAYGRYVGREMQNFFNKKAKIKASMSGALLSGAARDAIMKMPKVNRQMQTAKAQFRRSGVSVKEWDPVKFLSVLQTYMIGIAGGGLTGAPILTGRLIESINNRGFSTNDPDGLVVGTITVGSSEGNQGDVADLAPYWWKTVYAGAYYDLRKFGINKHKQWINARAPYWWGRSVKAALHTDMPKRLEIATIHHEGWQPQFRKQRNLTPPYLQPAMPMGRWESFELSAENVTDEDAQILKSMGYTPGKPY